MNNSSKSIKSISLDFVILFLLVIALSNALLGGLSFETSLIYWLVNFILLFTYSFLSLLCRHSTKLHSYKLYLVIFLIIWLIASIGFSQIYLRQTQGDFSVVHDGVIQMEEAIKYLLAGQNPYTLDYFNTTLEKLWDGQIGTSYGFIIQNPALYHFIALPFQLLFSALFYLLSTLSLGWYDQRFVYILLFFLSLLVVYKIPKKYSNKLLYLIIFAFNPLFIPYFIEGTNDIFVFFWIILTFYLLKNNKIKWSSLILSFAVLSKHSSWFLAPFYFIYLWLNQQKELSFSIKIKQLIKQTWPFWASLVIFLVPFLIWDFSAFIQDTYQYPSGSLATSYPINGIGLATFLLIIGLIKEPADYFPFWIPQFLIGLPIFYFLIRAQLRKNTLSQVMLNFGLLAFVFWFLSRFFHGNYIGFLSMLFISAYFLGLDDN